MTADPGATPPPAKPRSLLERLKPIFATFAHTSDVLTRDLPRWIRPVGRVALMLGFIVFVAVIFPFMPLFRRQHRRFVREWEEETRPVHELRARARRVWVENCPKEAAALIRSVFDRLRATPEGIEVPPFGRFAGVMCMHDLASAAYEYEFSVGRHAEALGIAEFMWSQHDSDIGLGPSWIVSRAKCLVRLGRAAEAKALLLEHRNLYDSAAEVNRYLDELRVAGS